MKILNYLIVVLFSGAIAFAQMPPASTPDIELTKTEADLRIQDFKKKVESLESKVDDLETKIEDLKTDLEDTNKAIEDCDKELMDLLGVNNSDIDAFRQELGELEGAVREMQRLSDDQLADRQDEVLALQARYDKLKMNKIALLPEFYNRVVDLGKQIKGLYREKKITTYTVGTWAENRDCLWNIAGKMEIYGDPHMWPKVWQANTDIIRNPDIIFPGQVLQIPDSGPKTSEELKAERKYYRMKKEAQAAETNVQTGADAE